MSPVSDSPETRYVKTPDGVHIAYQVVGDGPIDVVFASEWWFHLDAQWEDPLVSRFLRRLASFSRLVLFDTRGFGLSDPLPSGEVPTLEQTMADILTVMDAAGIERAGVLAAGDGTPVSVLLAATHPERVSALAVLNGFARQSAADDYPDGIPQVTQDVLLTSIDERWGTSDAVPFVAPSLIDDSAFREFFARSLRQSASRAAAYALTRYNFEMDVRDVLPAVAVPTVVYHRAADIFVSPALGRYVAEHVPGARYVELDGADHLWWLGDTKQLLDGIEELFTGAPPAGETRRVLATVLFTDIVDSTAMAAAMGDRQWRNVLDSHDQLVRRQLSRFGGREVKTTGDGFLALFDAPSQAVRCAAAVVAGVRPLGLAVRAGVHAGEVELRGEDVGGVGVHLGQRVAALAGPDEVLVSSTVKDLVVGSDIAFDDRGVHSLKGIPGEWRLFAVAF